MRRDVFQAIADPTRRAIVKMLAQQELNVNTIADNFEISRPAVSKHIKVLADCGLLTLRKEGRERICGIRLNKLREVDEWLSHYRGFWSNRLDDLGKLLEKNPEE